MTKILRLSSIGMMIFVIIVFLFSPFHSIRAVCPGDPGCPQVGDPGNNQGMPQPGDPGNPFGDSSSSSSNIQTPPPADTSLLFHLENPLGSSGPKTIPEFVAKVLDILVLIAIPIVTFFVIYSGLLFVLAAGNTEKLSKAKKTLMYTLIGAALVLGAKVLAEAIGSTLRDITAPTSMIINYISYIV